MIALPLIFILAVATADNIKTVDAAGGPAAYNAQNK